MKRSYLLGPILLGFHLCSFGQAWTPMEQTLTGSASSFFSQYGHSWADIDGDGDFDLFLNGSQLLWLNKVRDGQGFVSGADLLPPLSGGGGGWAACFGDFDNDGDPDVFCGNASTDYFLENRFPAKFVDVASSFGLTDPDWCQSINWVDYNKDGKLDIYITHERPGVDKPHAFYESDYPNPFIPRFPQAGGDDTFGLADKNSHAYGLTWADIDIDGDIDAVTSACGTSDTIPNENPHNKLYRNEYPTPAFTDMSLAVGLVDSQEVSQGSNSYWALLFDYDGNQTPDLFIGATGGAHRLWQNTSAGPGDLGIELVPNQVHGLQGSGAFLDGACAGDFDNDGDLDLYTTTNGVYERVEDGAFTRRSDLIQGLPPDASWVDYDLDGNLDLFNFQDLFRNPGGYGNQWLAVELEGDPEAGTTRDAHNVKIRLRANGVDQWREHRFMVGTYSQHLLPTHFGLGNAELIQELQVFWPDGSQQLLTNLTPNRYVTLIQNDDNPCDQPPVPSITISAFCAGTPSDLHADDPSGNGLSWGILDGPSTSLLQFSSQFGSDVTFTPQLSGTYTLAVWQSGCPQQDPIQIVVTDSDFNQDGSYTQADLLTAVPFWATAASEYDWDGDGIFSVLDTLLWCDGSLFGPARVATPPQPAMKLAAEPSRP